MTIKFQPTPAVPIENLPGSLPNGSIPVDTDAVAVLSSSLKNLQFLKEEHLHADSFWRDLLAFTGTFRTFHQPFAILTAWRELSNRTQVSDFQIKLETAQIKQVGPVGWIEGCFTFKTDGKWAGDGSGLLFVVPEKEEGWKIWMITTMLESVGAFGNPDVFPSANKNLANGRVVTNGTVLTNSTALINGTALTNGTAATNRTVATNGTSLTNGTVATNGSVERRDRGEDTADVVIVGAGHNGICLAARLKALGVEAIALEKEDEVGGNWTSRYDSVKLHTGKHFAHLPFEKTFEGSEYPYFLRGIDLAKAYKDYVNRYKINVRLSTTVESVDWVDHSGSWIIHALQHGKPYELKARHIVFATGAGGQQPKFPTISNKDAFLGMSIHSKTYKSSKAWKGKKGVVIGTANTGHDVAVDMVKAGLSSVTMVQRTPTPVVPMRWFAQAHNRAYHENSITIDADRREYSLPMSFYQNLANNLMKELATQEPEQFQALEQAGFRVQPVPNVVKIMFERQGGHYLDVGGSQMVIHGAIKMKSGEITRYVPTGLEFKDGSVLEADIIVFCTGFENDMRTMIASIVGPQTQEQLDHHWYVDKEGELRGAFKPVGHPRIWYTGGGVALGRFYSRFLALQIKADLAGVPFEPYKKIL